MTFARPVSGGGAGHLITLDDLDPSVLDRIVNDVSGLTMNTIPVPPSPPSDGVRAFTQQNRIRFIDRFGQAVDVLDSNITSLTLPESDTPARPSDATRTYVTTDGFQVAIGGSGTITVMAAP